MSIFDLNGIVKHTVATKNSSDHSLKVGSNNETVVNSISFGQNTSAVTAYSLAQGRLTLAKGSYSHAEGEGSTSIFNNDDTNTEIDDPDTNYNPLNGDHSGPNYALGVGSHVEGYQNFAKGDHSHAEGNRTITTENYSHAEGQRTTASGAYAHAEGNITTASGTGSHAEGLTTTASGDSSHAEGLTANATGYGSHAEGLVTTASGNGSHAEGNITTASGNYSHAEGYQGNSAGVASLKVGMEGHTYTSGEFAIGGGGANVLGGAMQTSIISMYATFNAVPANETATVPLIIDNGAGGSNKIFLRNNSAAFLNLRVIASMDAVNICCAEYNRIMTNINGTLSLARINNGEFVGNRTGVNVFLSTNDNSITITDVASVTGGRDFKLSILVNGGGDIYYKIATTATITYLNNALV